LFKIPAIYVIIGNGGPGDIGELHGVANRYQDRVTVALNFSSPPPERLVAFVKG
jgi:hypothetical protein